ncbi:elongation factor Ts, mitochondrial-like [Dorcoceras hygrometricum]|uniref:Elongation factor Ts, mitochondrial n=1 Tax=Dorcoceras hygrometricum TaxID=472368 RepID=A0A2Z7BPD8_9LAMI|nr:elongation factor Ts, mitochondrial-like [Dorcoceras hygrometricum]
MGFSRGLKCPVEFLYKRLNSPVTCGHLYSTSVAHRGSYLIMSSENCTSTFFHHSNPINHFEIYFKRNYSSEASASEQMNLIKQLREKTSAPIKDVKSALVTCNWDIGKFHKFPSEFIILDFRITGYCLNNDPCWKITEAAQKDLRKRGVVLASKKSSRTAAEGLLALAQNESKAVVVELNCETDFVARNEIFQNLALSLAKSALLLEGSNQSSVATPFDSCYLEDLKLNMNHPKLSGERSAQNAVTEVAAMMGENVKLGGGYTISSPVHGVLSTYLHTSPQPGIGRIAGLLSLEVEDKNAPLSAVERVGSELAMHVVAAKPLFLTKEDVSSDALENEREVLRSQAESTGKSQMAIDKMVEGRLRKYFEEVVLLQQKFIVDDTVNIKTLLNNLSEEVGSKVKIGNFLRLEVGELQRLHASKATQALAQAA